MTKTATRKKPAPKKKRRKKAGPGHPGPGRPRYMTDVRPGSVKDGPRRSRGRYVCDWIETNCVHTDGEWIGKPFRLLPWQRGYIMRLFETGADGRRLARWSYLSVAKKNGKTEIAAALALFFAFGSGEPSALVVCAAGSDDQADLVFKACRIMCEQSPTLSLITQVLERDIVCPTLPGSKVRRYAVGGGRLDGPNIYVAIIDELHEWTLPKHEKTWTVITQGGANRREPLVLMITTAGADREHTVCGQQYDHSVKVATGQVQDPSWHCEIWEPPDDADHKDPETWAYSSPSLGVTVSVEYLQDLARRRAENVFRRYFCNQWVDAEDRAIPSEEWHACKVGPKAQLSPDEPTWVMVDLSKNRDSTAVAVAQRITYRRKPRVLVKVRIWENPYPPQNPLHNTWELNVFEVENYLTELYHDHPVATLAVDDEEMAGPAFFYDPMFFKRSAQLLEGEGLNMVEFPQTDQRMCPAYGNFREMIKTKVLAHDGDPVLARHVGSVTEDEKPRGIRATKPRGSKRKIDGAIAALVAASQAWMPEEVEEAYEPTIH